MRHPLPFIAAAMSTLFACAGVGIGLIVWFNVPWAFPIAVTLGLILVAGGAMHYRRANEATRTKVYRLATTLYIAEFGVILGGAPGAILGRLLADDMGEMIGWFLTAIPVTILAVVWGWRWSCRHLV